MILVIVKGPRTALWEALVWSPPVSGLIEDAEGFNQLLQARNGGAGSSAQKPKEAKMEPRRPW